MFLSFVSACIVFITLFNKHNFDWLIWFFIYNLSKRQSVQSYAKTCHFLPVKFRICYKLCLTVYKIINGMAPDYLMDFSQHIVRNRQNLRSSSDNLILQLPTCNKTLRFHLIKSWNVLPFELRSISSIERFKTSLKTFYFTQAYDWIIQLTIHILRILQWKLCIKLLNSIYILTFKIFMLYWKILQPPSVNFSTQKISRSEALGTVSNICVYKYFCPRCRAG